jgi:phosphoenolpyruvate carboxykinase (GTP)
MVGTDFVGDDLAQLWISSDGTLRAINPEIGIFGIIQDVNRESDPYLAHCLMEPGSEVIWSNVLVDDALRPRWVGDCGPAPEGGRNWLGAWSPEKKDHEGRPTPISHPNARVTLRILGIQNYNAAAASDPDGVPVGVVTYSGRDSDTMPPVWAAKTPEAGVVIGASILSAATATEVGATGVKRQPWANTAFIPGPLGEYMRAQFEFFGSSSLKVVPLIAGLNYFLTREARGGTGKGLLGEKRDVIVWLTWLERRLHGEVGAIDTPIGLLPVYEDLARLFGELIEKEYPRELYVMQFSLYLDRIISRIDLQEAAYRLEQHVPDILFEIYAEQRSGLQMLRRTHGPIVAPETMGEISGVH